MAKVLLWQGWRKVYLNFNIGPGRETGLRLKTRLGPRKERLPQKGLIILTLTWFWHSLILFPRKDWAPLFGQLIPNFPCGLGKGQEFLGWQTRLKAP